MTRLGSFLAAIALAAILAAPSAGSRELPPPPSAPKPFALAAPRTFALDNGLAVTFVQFGAVPKAAVTVAVDAGNFHEGADTWLADVVGEMLKEGTATRTAMDVAIQAADMGGDLAVSVTPDQTLIATDVLSDFAPDAIRLLADVLQNPRFPESELPRIQQNLLRSLSVGRSDPGALAQEAFLKLLFGGHPYGAVFATPAQIKGYAIADAKRFYAENYGAKRTRIYVVGRFDEDAAEKAIREAFGGFAAGPERLTAPPAMAGGFRVKLIERPGSQQATLILGLPALTVADADYAPFYVMHTLLAGAYSSRITKNIRENKGYTYSPSAAVTHRKGLAYWNENADVTNSVTGPALHEIFAEIARLQGEVPPADEVDKVQNYLAGIFVLQNGSRGGITRQIAFLDLQGLDFTFLNGYVGKVLAVSDAEVSAMAKKHLPLDGFTLVVVGDLAAVGEQVRNLPELEDAEFLP